MMVSMSDLSTLATMAIWWVISDALACGVRLFLRSQKRSHRASLICVTFCCLIVGVDGS